MLAGELISRWSDVLFWDPRIGGSKRRKSPLRNRIFFGSRAEAAGQEYVLLAMPVSEMEGVLRSIVAHLRRGALVADVCAVKRIPCSLLKRWVPKGVLAVGTHPLFGPDSYSGTLTGHRIIVCPAQPDGKALSRVRRLLGSTGADIEVMSPVAHDRLMAKTVFLTQCVGRWLAGAGLGRITGTTVHYEHLRSIINVAMNDSAGLFEDMWRFNPSTRDVVRKLGRSWDLMERSVAPVPKVPR